MNSQSHIPGQRLTKETECLAKETTSFAPQKRVSQNEVVELSVSQKELLELASHKTHLSELASHKRN